MPRPRPVCRLRVTGFNAQLYASPLSQHFLAHESPPWLPTGKADANKLAESEKS